MRVYSKVGDTKVRSGPSISMAGEIIGFFMIAGAALFVEGEALSSSLD